MTMDSLICIVLYLASLVFNSVSGVRYRYTGYRYSSYRYYYNGYRYTYYYYAGSSSGGGIAGIVVGCVIIVGGIVACIVSFCILCRRRKRTAGRLITPAVYSPNTAPATGTVAMHGNISAMEAEVISASNANKPSGEAYPNGFGQESGHPPPSYDMAVAGTNATSTGTSGYDGGVASSSNTDTAPSY